MKHVLPFLTALKQNNDRSWFNQHKGEYEIARLEFASLIDDLLAGLSQMDPRLRGIGSKDSIFRIYRDTRFSNDKTPYKTQMGAYMTYGGKSSPEPGYYLHIEPNGCFVAGGMYSPPSDRLKAIRQEIYNFPEDYLAITGTDEFKSKFNWVEEDKLVRPPQGYSADFQLIDVLKRKHFCPFTNYPDNWVTEPDFKERLMDLFVRMQPFNEFLYRAIHA